MKHKNAGTPSLKSPKSTLSTELAMRKPTITRAGAVANDGMARKIGERNIDGRNSTAVVTTIRPVRPPSAMPAAHSTEQQVTELPSAPASIVASDSLMSAPRATRPAPPRYLSAGASWARACSAKAACSSTARSTASTIFW